MSRGHIMDRIAERFNGTAADKAAWITLVDVMLRHKTLGSIRDVVGSGDFRIVHHTGQLIVGGWGKPVSFFLASSQAKEKKIDRALVIGLYQRAGLWAETVQPLDWAATAKWFVRFENHNPEVQGATRTQVEIGMTELGVAGWTDQTLEDLVRKGKVNKVDGYYFLSRISWAEVMAWTAVGVGLVATGAHLFL